MLSLALYLHSCDSCIQCVWLAGTSASAMDVSASGAVASTASAGSEKKSRAAPSSERCFGNEWVHIQAPGQRREGHTGEILLTRAMLPELIQHLPVISAEVEEKSQTASSSERCLGNDWDRIQATGQRKEGHAGGSCSP